MYLSGREAKRWFWTVDEVIQFVYFWKLNFCIVESDAYVPMIFYVAVLFFTMDMQQRQTTEYVELK